MALFTAIPTQDTFLFSLTPAVANGALGAMIVGTYRPLSATGFARGLMRIPLLVPVNAVFSELTLTTLSLGTNELASGPITINAYRLLQPAWTEAATWNTYNGTNNWVTAGASNSYTTDNSDSAQITAFNSALVLSGLAGMANDALAAGLSNLDVLLIGPETVDGPNNSFLGFTREESTVEDRPLASGVWDYPADAESVSWVSRDEPLHWRATDEPLHWVAR